MAQAVSPSRALDLMSRYGLRPRKGLGQNFLVDPNTASRIVRLAGLQPATRVLEIGPGLGSLTVALAASAAEVIAVEVDARVALALEEVVGDMPNVRIVVADALAADLHALAGGPVRLVANLPYRLATPLFVKVLRECHHASGGLLMTQQEVGERWCAGPGSKTYGAVSVKVGYHASARLADRVSPTVFLPRPNVDSVLVAFDRHPPPVVVDDPARFFRFVECAFAQRRKTVRNALRAWGTPDPDAALDVARIEASRRPEQLGLADFAALYGAAA